ncbi:MAG: serine--tRNA ligase [Myxococcales bacterium]|nr:serine--tRNA ligase [Myxococcales bacterium]|tara:strand:- start:2625 stop:3893 length:1269 start_codon:yes stop_codon:yes gene_type:complete
MLDLKRIQSDAETVQTALFRRNNKLSIDDIVRLDAERRKLVQEHEGLRHTQKSLSDVFRGSAPAEEKAKARGELKEISDRVKGLHEARLKVEDELNSRLMELPNIPSETTPDGRSEEDNVVVREVGEIPSFSFEPRDHVALGEALGILDFERGSKITGSRFAVYYREGARLERALQSFMLDQHVDRGYTEVFTPFLVNRDALTGTGQLPKFEEDAFVTQDDLFLIPTAEVPVTNLLRDEILEPGQLPVDYAAYSACFRREAGSYGKVTRGLIRLHQFQKVEMVKICSSEDSEREHERLVDDAEEVLRRLELPYRVVELCTGDLGFSAQRCFDLEVWSPGQNRYVEISSVSNFGDFQARRANIRYRPEAGAKPRFCHTLNGSGLAIGRTIVALLENGQQEDGSVRIPEALVPYMGGLERIEAK